MPGFHACWIRDQRRRTSGTAMAAVQTETLAHPTAPVEQALGVSGRRWNFRDLAHFRFVPAELWLLCFLGATLGCCHFRSGSVHAEAPPFQEETPADPYEPLAAGHDAADEGAEAIMPISVQTEPSPQPLDPTPELGPAEPRPGPPDADPALATDAPLSTEQALPSWLKIGGLVEVFYQWNFNRPAGGVTDFRGFDSRHNAFTISNAMLDAQWDYRGVFGRLALQIGHTPATYYLAEPAVSAGEAVNSSDLTLWQFLQEAYVGYRFAALRDLRVSAGLHLSPVGIEDLNIYRNSHWSRSNLFFALPYYHTGVKGRVAFARHWTASLWLVNGYNSVVDNNREKSLVANVAYNADGLAASLLYFGGVERDEGAAEGRAWRHLFDAHASLEVHPKWVLQAHANAGFEAGRLGVAYWAAAALYARHRLLTNLYLATRGDVFYEGSSGGSADARPSPMFWPVSWVASATATLDFRLLDHLSLMLEARHDHAADRLFLASGPTAEGPAPLLPTRSRTQQTLTLGVTAWF